MEETAAKSLIDMLGKILVEGGKYLWGVEEEVEKLREELLWMRSSLREADTMQHKDEIVSMWVCQVQKYVNEAEDIVDNFVIRVVSRRQQKGLLNKLRRYSCIFRELNHLRQTASSIDSLTNKISTLSPKLDRYGLLRSSGKHTDPVEQARTAQVQQILKNVHMEDKKIVGFNEDAKEIINVLKSSQSRKRFHAIYGMGGSGKTTLARKVFKDDVIKHHFIDGQAFVYISKQFKLENVLRELLEGLNHESSETGNELLVHRLQQVLQEKKCLVVVDDVWTKEAWDSLEQAFITCGGDSGSKLLLTTRKEDVAKHVDIGALQKPDLLKDEEAWNLLQQTIEWHPQDISTQEQDRTEIFGRNDDCAKIELGKKMLKVCKGVPLAIVVLGGILRKKKSFAEWQSVFQNISSQLIMGYDHGRSCMEILLQSYDDLPYHLKPCFLHLASFPEDYRIWTKNLYWIWVAEGLVTRSKCDRTAGTKSLEDVANDYLTDLAQAGLVEIVEKNSKGLIEIIRMHDLVRDVCLEKATTDNFLQTIDLRSGRDQQPNSFDFYSEKRLLRMSVFLPDDTIRGFITESVSSKAHKYLRSLLFIPDKYGRNEQDIGECKKFMTQICSEFRLLRVLVLKDLELGGRLSSQVEKLIHLRYLSLRRTGVFELPSSIGKLMFLEILDLRVSGQLVIPNTLWKLFQLRHLLFPKKGYEIKWSKKLRVDTLICLETIQNLLVQNLRTNDMVKIQNLRKLSISEKLSKEAISDIRHALQSSRLQSCSIRVEGNALSEDPIILSGIVCRTCCLEILEPIQGQNLENIKFPQYLEELVLNGCNFEDDPMSILGRLYHLKTLELRNEAYVGLELSCGPTTFPLLEKLKIERLTNLEALKVEIGSMPNLTSLKIWACVRMNRFPDVLPLSVKSFVFFNEQQDDHVDLGSNSGAVQMVYPCGNGEWLTNVVLGGQHERVVILGRAGAGKTTNAINLYCNEDVNRHFDAVALTWAPRRRSRTATSDLLPRRSLEQLLRDLQDPRESRDGQELSKMGCDDLTAELQQTMQQRRCLVILLNLEVDDFGHLDAVLENTFGRRECYAGNGSKLVITCQSYIEPLDAAIQCHVFRLRSLTELETLKMHHKEDNEYWRTNAGITWNLMRHCFGDPLSIQMFVGLLKMKENIQEWGAQNEEIKEVTYSGPIIEFSQIFALCYDDLQPHLRKCLIHLANFPQEVEISTQNLYQMWIANGFVVPNQEEVQTEESLENLASSYLSELVQRGMVIVLKAGPDRRAETCQIRFALRDLCLQRAREDNMCSRDTHFVCCIKRTLRKLTEGLPSFVRF